MTVIHNELKDLPLPQQLKYWAKNRPNVTALRQKQYGVWNTISWAEYEQQSRWFGLGMLQLGLKPGQTVAILGENCKEWVFAQMGTAMLRCVTAGVYPTSPAPEVEYLLSLAEAPIIVVEDQEQLDKVLEIRHKLPTLLAIVVIDPRGLRKYDRTNLHDFTDVVELG
ncbi:MAG: AMP-binding protein, partial [Burkholderiaceae bacterium]